MKRMWIVSMAVLFVFGLAGLSRADFIGNKTSKVFHDPSCALAKQMKDDNKAVFKTTADAGKDGFTACKKCAPTDPLFIGNTGSMMYHKKDCRMAANIKAENSANLASEDAAKKAGYKPCSICLGVAKDKK